MISFSHRKPTLQVRDMTDTELAVVEDAAKEMDLKLANVAAFGS